MVPDGFKSQNRKAAKPDGDGPVAKAAGLESLFKAGFSEENPRFYAEPRPPAGNGRLFLNVHPEVYPFEKSTIEQVRPLRQGRLLL